jgi:Holliday junction resolvase
VKANQPGEEWAQPRLFAVPSHLSERQWQSTITKRLTEEGYRHQHVYRLRTSDGNWRTSTTAKGWPDIVALRGPYLLAIECKGPAGRIEPGQIEWLESFAEIPTGRGWLLAPDRTDWQALADWIHDPEHAPRRYGWDPETRAKAPRVS